MTQYAEAPKELEQWSHLGRRRVPQKLYDLALRGVGEKQSRHWFLVLRVTLRLGKPKRWRGWWPEQGELCDFNFDPWEVQLMSSEIASLLHSSEKNFAYYATSSSPHKIFSIYQSMLLWGWEERNKAVVSDQINDTIIQNSAYAKEPHLFCEESAKVLKIILVGFETPLKQKTNIEMPLIPIAGGGLNIVAGLLYFQQMRQNQSKPNPASWIVWSFIGILNVLSWSTLSESSFWDSFQFWVSVTAVLLITLYASFTSRFSHLNRHEIVILVLGIVASLFWWFFQSAEGANMIIIVAYILSYIPTIEGLLKDPQKERPLPWVFWGLAFGFSAANILVTKSDILGVLSPGILMGLHLTVAWLASRKVDSPQRLEAKENHQNI